MPSSFNNIASDVLVYHVVPFLDIRSLVRILKADSNLKSLTPRCTIQEWVRLDVAQMNSFVHFHWITIPSVYKGKLEQMYKNRDGKDVNVLKCDFLEVCMCIGECKCRNIGEEVTNFYDTLPIGIFPSTLKEIITPFEFRGTFENGLFPESLEQLTILETKWDVLKIQDGLLPKNLKRLIIKEWYANVVIENLPESLEKLDLSNVSIGSIKRGFFPPNLKELHLPGDFEDVLEIGLLPESLEELYVNGSYTELIQIGALPKNLRKIRFSGYSFDDFPIGVFPESLRYLELDRGSEQTIPPGLLPNGLKTLSIVGCYFCKLLPGSLPESLEELHANSCVGIEEQYIPETVKVHWYYPHEWFMRQQRSNPRPLYIRPINDAWTEWISEPYGSCAWNEDIQESIGQLDHFITEPTIREPGIPFGESKSPMDEPD